MSTTAVRRSTERTVIVAARRPAVHLEQAYPMSGVYPSAHTAQTGGPGEDDGERDRAGWGKLINQKRTKTTRLHTRGLGFCTARCRGRNLRRCSSEEDRILI